MKFLVAAAALSAALSPLYASGQSPCHGSALSGIVRDSTLAVVAGAEVSVDNGPPMLSDAAGRFRVPCVIDGPHRIAISAEGFARGEVSAAAPRTTPVEVVLELAEVQTQMDVNGQDDTPATSAASIAC